MTRLLLVAAALWLVALCAPPDAMARQAPPPPNIAAPHPSPQPAPTASAPVTLTGCLERSKPASLKDAGRPTSGGSNTPPTAYVLRADAPASASAGSAGVLYNIIAVGPAVKFDGHVGHRVELTGTLRAATNQQAGLSNDGVSPSTPSGSTGMETIPPPDPAPHAERGMPSVAQPIFVESLKMLASRCGSGTD